MDGATNDRGGDLVSLYAYINGLKQYDAAKELSKEWTTSSTVTTTSKKTNIPKDDNYTLCLPVPDDAPDTYKVIKFVENYITTYREPSMVHTYTDANGAVLRLIYRFEAKNGLSKKEFRPLTCWRDKSGKAVWRFKDIPNNRPLYGLESLARRPNDPVLVVSGEKCVDIIREILKSYVIVTWSGGDNGAPKTDFEPLKGRKLIWWPDNDDSGKNTMRRLADNLGGRIIYVDSEKYPKGWDCADAIAAGWDTAKIENFINTIIDNIVPKLSELAPKEIFVHTTDKGKLLGTIENLQALMKYYKLEIWYDEINRIQKCSIGGIVSDDINRFYSIVRSVCNLNELPPSWNNISAFLDYESRSNKKNPVVEWINSRPWDEKVSRVNVLCEAVHCDDSITVELKETLILTWLLSAYAGVSREDGDSFRARGVLVLQGRQGIGKTSFLRDLCGAKWGGDIRWFGEGLTLDADNKDSVLNAQSFWITELAELENTTKRSIPALKALITNSSITIRRPYMAAAEKIWVRTTYAGTVNQKDVLPDLTGNSRFWCLPVVKFGDISDIDMQQVWAEVKYFKDRGSIWWLTPEQEAQLSINNMQYMISSPVEELLSEKLDWDTKFMPQHWEQKTCTTILKECGMNNPSQGDARRAAYYMRKKLCMEKAPKAGPGGVRLYPCPPLKWQGASVVQPAEVYRNEVLQESLWNENY